MGERSPSGSWKMWNRVRRYRKQRSVYKENSEGKGSVRGEPEGHYRKKRESETEGIIEGK